MALVDELYLTDIKHRSDFVQTSGAGNLGDLELETGRENLRQALLRRLMTSPGSIVHRPTYGVGIKDYQGSVSTLDQKRSLAQKISDQFEEDDRVEEVLGVRVESEDETPEKVKITVRVKPIGLTEIQVSYTPFGGEVI